MLAIRLPQEIESRLSALAEKTGIAPSLLNKEGTGLDGGFNYLESFKKEYAVIEKEIVPLFSQQKK